MPDKTLHSFRVSWLPILFVLVTLGLAWTYLLSVEAHRYATADDSAFIRPLCYILTALAPFVIWTCVERQPDPETGPGPLSFGSVVVALAVPVAFLGIAFVGFAPTAAIGGFALCLVLSRNLWHALAAAAISLLIVTVLFAGLLDVGLPLWPGVE